MFVALVRAPVLSGMGLSLRASSYAKPIPLITITALYKHRKAVVFAHVRMQGLVKRLRCKAEIFI